MTFPESKDPLTGNRKLHSQNATKSKVKTSKVSINPQSKKDLALVKKDADNLEKIENPTSEIIEAALKKGGHSIRFVKNPTLEQIKIAINQNGGALGYVDNQTPELIEMAIKQNPFSIGSVKKQTLSNTLQAARMNPHVLISIDDKTLRNQIKKELRHDSRNKFKVPLDALKIAKKVKAINSRKLLQSDITTLEFIRNGLNQKEYWDSDKGSNRLATVDQALEKELIKEPTNLSVTDLDEWNDKYTYSGGSPDVYRKMISKLLKNNEIKTREEEIFMEISSRWDFY